MISVVTIIEIGTETAVFFSKIEPHWNCVFFSSLLTV